MKTKWLINPFERIAGWLALAAGLVVMALTTVIGKLNHVAFDGALDAHTGADFGFSAAFTMQAVNFLVLFIFGICFSKTRIRTVDVAATAALARTPMLLLSMIYFLPMAPAGVFG